MIGKKLSYEKVVSLFPQTFLLVNSFNESPSARSRTTSGKQCSARYKRVFNVFAMLRQISLSFLQVREISEANFPYRLPLLKFTSSQYEICQGRERESKRAKNTKYDDEKRKRDESKKRYRREDALRQAAGETTTRNKGSEDCGFWNFVH